MYVSIVYKLVFSLSDNSEKFLVFIINHEENILFLLSDFETNAIYSSVRFDNYDKS